jgi:hypothetical protein
MFRIIPELHMNWYETLEMNAMNQFASMLMVVTEHPLHTRHI